MADDDGRRLSLRGHRRATRWVFVAHFYPAQTAANARLFLRYLARCRTPMKIHRVAHRNGKAFTDRLFGLRKRSPTG